MNPPPLLPGQPKQQDSPTASAQPLSMIGFPQLFSGLIDDAPKDAEQNRNLNKDRNNKEQPPVAVQTQESQSPVLPFVLNIQLPQAPSADSTHDHSPTAPTAPRAAAARFSSQQEEQAPIAVETQDSQSPVLPFLLNIQLPQAPSADSTREETPHAPVQQVGPPPPPRAAAARFSPQEKEQPPASVQTQDAQSPVLPLLLNVQPQTPDTDSTPAPEPQTAPTSPPPRRAVVPAFAPQQPTAAPSGSPWKQTTEKLPDAELAFAARVLTPDVKGKQQTAESAPMEPGTALPTAKSPIPVKPPDNPPDSDRQNSSAPPSKPDQPASPRKPSAPESSSPETRPEPPARTPTAPAELAPVSPPPASFQPANQTAKPQHVSQTAEPRLLPEQPASQPGSPIRDFSLRLSANNQDKVEVKVVETAGEIRVAVRSADPELTTSLQQGIGDLVGKLEDRGMRTEMWKPPVEAATATAPTHSEAGANNQQQSSGDGSQGRQWREQQILPPRRRNKPDWLREIDGTFDTLHSDITRRTA